MRKNSWIAWLVVLAGIFAVVQIKPQIVPQVKSELQSANNQIQPYVYLIKANIKKNYLVKEKPLLKNKLAKLPLLLKNHFKE